MAQEITAKKITSQKITTQKITEKTHDKELVQRFLRGEAECFVELVNRYSDKVYRLGMRITRSEQDTEEVVQDVFLTIHEKLHTFQGKSAFSSWLYRITANAAFMKLRTRRKHAASNLDDMSLSEQSETLSQSRQDTVDVDYMSSQHEMKALLQEALASLPEEYQTIFVLRDVDGLSNEEVGEVLGLTIPAVKSRLHRSRLLLRKKLQRFYDDYVSSDKIFYGFHPQARGTESYAMAA